MTMINMLSQTILDSNEGNNYTEDLQSSYGKQTQYKLSIYRHHFYVIFGEVEWHCVNDDEYNK